MYIYIYVHIYTYIYILVYPVGKCHIDFFKLRHRQVLKIGSQSGPIYRPALLPYQPICLVTCLLCFVLATCAAIVEADFYPTDMHGEILLRYLWLKI
jgi:hypothetical protein